MNTLFQTSTNLAHLQPGLQSLEQAFLPVSIKISLSGPHGPVGPAHQKLSSSGMKKTRSLAMPKLIQILAASVSLGTLSLPAKTVTLILSTGIFSTLVRNS